jgi:hypothetical protein
MLIRQAVKAVAINAAFGDFAGKREQLCKVGLVPVERRIETCDLRQVRATRLDDPDQCEIVGLV